MSRFWQVVAAILALSLGGWAISAAWGPITSAIGSAFTNDLIFVPATALAVGVITMIWRAVNKLQPNLDKGMAKLVLIGVLVGVLVVGIVHSVYGYQIITLWAGRYVLLTLTVCGMIYQLRLWHRRTPLNQLFWVSLGAEITMLAALLGAMLAI